MTSNISFSPQLIARLEKARDEVVDLLLARQDHSHWSGELSTSALSTATASLALTMFDAERVTPEEVPSGAASHARLVERGLSWLVEHANDDGGWGDTVRSRSNLSTTTLCWAALVCAGKSGDAERIAIDRARAWIDAAVGGDDVSSLAAAITSSYGEDRTFSVPILTHCALAGALGSEKEAWHLVKQLPFELASLPRSWFRFLGLPVVSYALPALIAIGQVRHHHLPTSNPFSRAVRNKTRRRTLRLLQTIQPESGGFLEAVPLTSFVAMSLAGCGQSEHPVTRSAIRFLESSVRDDGSWPIDTNLATWVTTLSVNALAAGPQHQIEALDAASVRSWLLEQQYRDVHFYTMSPPGGWAWTDLSGGVPDADDTAGALLALNALPREHSREHSRVREAAARGVHWLLGVQNRDGGIPTFCRGWGNLPFDRSGADLSAHVLAAFSVWRHELEPALGARVDRAARRLVAYLERAQRGDGAWVPLWFGNEVAEGFENPVYGTSRVLDALARLVTPGSPRERACHGWADAGTIAAMVKRGSDWLAGVQQRDGGWGGDGVAASACGRAPAPAPMISSVEETAMALSALTESDGALGRHSARIERGAEWLLSAVASGCLERPTPIGFYFANLWYYEKLYPLIFSASALNRLCAKAGRAEGSSQ